MTEEDLGLAHRLADLADGISESHFGGGALEVEAKADGTPVTRVDREIESALREALARERPREGFLGEECGSRGPVDRRWIVDGVDGTASFVAGEPEWSTLIARQVHAEVVVGLVSAPALNRRWYAVTGRGAWTRRRDTAAEPRRLAVSTTRELRAATVAIWPPAAALPVESRPPIERLTAASARILPGAHVRKPSYGSGTCHGALLVAEGLADLFLLTGGGPWDLAALVPIVEEAGGRFSDLSGGRDIEGPAGLFSNGMLHDQVLDLLDRGD